MGKIKEEVKKLSDFEIQRKQEEEAKSKEHFTMIWDSLINDESLTPTDKFIYVLLSGNMSFRNRLTISIDNILELMGNTLHSKNRKLVKESIFKLYKNGSIKVYKTIMARDEFDFENEKMKNEKDYTYVLTDKYEKSGVSFAKLYESEMMKFENMKEDRKAYIFMAWFHIAKLIFNGATAIKYSRPGIKTLSEELDCHENTVSKYIKKLEENEILFIYTTYRNKNELKNFYSRMHNKLSVTMELDKTFKNGNVRKALKENKNNEEIIDDSLY